MVRVVSQQMDKMWQQQEKASRQTVLRLMERSRELIPEIRCGILEGLLTAHNAGRSRVH